MNCLKMSQTPARRVVSLFCAIEAMFRGTFFGSRLPLQKFCGDQRYKSMSSG